MRLGSPCNAIFTALEVSQCRGANFSVHSNSPKFFGGGVQRVLHIKSKFSRLFQPLGASNASYSNCFSSNDYVGHLPPFCALLTGVIEIEFFVSVETEQVFRNQTC